MKYCTHCILPGTPPELSREDLAPYFGPGAASLRAGGPRTGPWGFVDIDDEFISVPDRRRADPGGCAG